jgi:hypothetical protein
MWQASCRWHHDVVKQRLEQTFERGSIAQADLWLDSSVAVAIAKRESVVTGDDGWPAAFNPGGELKSTG